jgi:rare lipoprotein A
MNTALAVGVFVVSSCVEQRSVGPVVPPPSVPEAPPTAPPSTVVAPAIQTGYATYYAARFAGRRTANGERYEPSQLTAAHRTLPFGTMLEVRRLDGDRRAVVVRVNDRGPYVRDRIIDLSHRAAEQLGMLRDGKALVELRTASTPP